MAVPSVPRFYSWAQLTYQATRGRSGTAPGRGHQRGAKGGPRFGQGFRRRNVPRWAPFGQQVFHVSSLHPMGGGGPGPRPAVPAWGIVSALRIYRRRSVQIQAAKTNRATMQTAIPARTIASNGSMAASMPAQAPGGNPGGRIGAQPFAQADTLRGRHPRPHQSTGAADPDQGGGAGGRGENRGGGSGVSICPEKLSL